MLLYAPFRHTPLRRQGDHAWLGLRVERAHLLRKGRDKGGLHSGGVRIHDSPGTAPLNGGADVYEFFVECHPLFLPDYSPFLFSKERPLYEDEGKGRVVSNVKVSAPAAKVDAEVVEAILERTREATRTARASPSS